MHLFDLLDGGAVGADGPNPVGTIEGRGIRHGARNANEDDDLVAFIAATGTGGEDERSRIITMSVLFGTAAAADIGRNGEHLGKERRCVRGLGGGRDDSPARQFFGPSIFSTAYLETEQNGVSRLIYTHGQGVALLGCKAVQNAEHRGFIRA